MSWRLGDDGDGVDFHKPFRARQRRYDETGRDRKNALQIFTGLAIDWFAIARIGNIDCDLANMLKLRTGFFEQRSNVCHGLVGLADRVTDADARCRIEILSDLAPNEH